MIKDPLVSILGEEIRAKIVRLLVINKTSVFDKEEIIKSLKVSKARTLTVIKNLIADGIVINKKGVRRVEKKVKGKLKTVREEFTGIAFNSRYKYRAILEDLILHTIPSDRDILIKRLASLSGLKILITTGIFARDNDATADLLLVGDDMDDKEIESIIKGAETIIGRDLRCIILDTNEFVYRFNIHDQLIRGILDYQHFVHADFIGIIEDNS